MKALYLYQFGKGNIGSALIRQILTRQETLRTRYGLHFEYIGLCGQTRALFHPAGIGRALRETDDLDALLNRHPGSFACSGADVIIDELVQMNIPDLCVIDTTAADMTATHLTCLRNGIPVVTANKKPLTADLPVYLEMMRLGCGHERLYWYETTAGAGLPVISLLRELIATGDTVTEIRGCLSGTLGYICSRMDEEGRFSDIVDEARRLGYSEPDPRDDLNGLDVARKALILAREMGHTLNLSDIGVESMVSESLLRAESVEAFMAALPDEDAGYDRRIRQCRERGDKLRYVASIRGDVCAVGLQAVPENSPIGRLSGPDNIIVSATARYHDRPLIVQGPGAGPEVTAGGLFGDLIKAATAG